ncbi:hypothetical protein BKA70DRAFT_886548 [Coprinopsis sp. MPI-PUGE-AT-0042]|nr:hypothetical protein BKA70DRAFT_886548 [Coprinopsis sp. MPI-PUGE-AT-0042]
MGNFSSRPLVKSGLPPDIIRIGRSGSALTEGQRNSITNLKDQYEANYRQVSDQILESKEPRSRQELRSLRAQLEEKIDMCEGLLSPVRQIPLDVLVEIFQYCVAQPHAWEKSSLPAAILCRVSRSWHAAATSTSALWSPAWIDAKRHLPPEDPMIGAGSVASHLHRLNILANRLWSLTVDAKGAGYTDFIIGPSTKPPEPLDVLFEHPAFERLRKLRIDSDDFSDVWFRNLSSVDSLVMRWPASDQYCEPDLGRPSPHLPHLPSVTKLILSSFSSSFVRLPRANLTHLYIGGVGLSVGQWQLVMIECENLQHGVFSIDDDGTIADPLTPPVGIHQPYLSTLTLFLCDRFNPSCGIHWPRLRTLNGYVAKLITEDVPWFLDIHAPSTLLPSLSSLTRLVLACDDYEHRNTDFRADVLPILLGASGLEHFYLHSEEYGILDFFIFDPDNMSQQLCPRLLSLGFHFRWGWQDGWSREENEEIAEEYAADIENMVRSRARTIKRALDAPEERITPLEAFVIRMDEAKCTRLIAEEMKKRLKKYSKSEAGDIRIGVELCGPSLGMKTLNQSINWEHWDEGFTDYTAKGELSPIPSDNILI